MASGFLLDFRTMLTLRKVIGFPHAPNVYCVVYDGVEVGSIGVQVGQKSLLIHWAWGLTAFCHDESFRTSGTSESRQDAMAAFKIAWEKFIADPDRLKAMRDARR